MTINYKSPIPIIIGVILLCSYLGSSQYRQFTQEQIQEVKLQQHQKREKVNLTSINLQSLTFQNRQGQEVFIVETSQTEVVKGQIYVYWNTDNVFISSDVKDGQEITLTIVDNQINIIDQHRFYTLTAFMFNAQKGKKYKIKINSIGGSIPKLFSMSLSRTSPALAQKQIKQIVKDQFGSQMESILQKFQNNMEPLGNRFLLNYLLGKYLIQLNDKYYYYQFFELTVIIVVSVLQVILIKKMLRRKSIV